MVNAPAVAKTIVHNGRQVRVRLPSDKRRGGGLHPCTGRYLVNCTNGAGCRGHKVTWIILRELWG